MLTTLQPGGASESTFQAAGAKAQGPGCTGMVEGPSVQEDRGWGVARGQRLGCESL